MDIVEIKMTAARSNPQLIREIQIDADRTVEELLKLVGALFERTSTGNGRISNESGVFLAREQKLRNALHAGDFLTIFYNKEKTDTVFLEILEEKKEMAALDIPVLKRVRGIKTGRRTNRYGENEDPMETFRKQINREIRKLFAPDTVPPEFKWELAQPLSMLLQNNTAVQLKEYVKRKHLDVNLYLRKAELLQAVAREISTPEFLKNQLEEMSMREYMEMRKVLLKGSAFHLKGSQYEVFPVLSENYLIESTYWGTLNVAKEFMDFYELWLSQGNEKEYMKKRAAEICFYAAKHLYGLADKKILKELLEIGYPELDSGSETEIFWKGLRKNSVRYGTEKIPGQDGYYNTEDLSGDTAALLYQNHRAMGDLHYKPEKSEIMVLAFKQIGFRDETEAHLVDIINRKAHYSEEYCRLVVMELARGVHIGVDTEELMQYLRKSLGARFKTDVFQEIRQILDGAQKTMRKISLGGYTQQEMDRIFEKRQPTRTGKKIYPNDPCPCGSGKKYKNCCGRR